MAFAVSGQIRGGFWWARAQSLHRRQIVSDLLFHLRSADGALEDLAIKAGLTPASVKTVECPWDYPDEKTALRGLLSSGPAIRAMQINGEEVVREAVLQVIARYKTSSGGYYLTNTFRYLIAAA